MTHMEIQAPTRIAPNGYKVDVSRGQRIGRVSSEWFNRPDDERYLSLTDLNNAVRRRSERSKDPYRRKRDNPCRSVSRQSRAADAHAAGCPRLGRADALEFWPARQPGRRARHLLAAIEPTKVRRVVGDQDIAVIDSAPGHHMILRACQTQPAHMAGLRRELRQIRTQAFVDQELHEAAGKSSRRIVRDDFGGAFRQTDFTGGRPRRG